MDAPRDPARLRQLLNPLTTNALAPYNAQLNTPVSAAPMASPHVHSVHTPASTIQPYNPQEWAQSPAPAPAVMPPADRTRQFPAAEPQAAVLPPPPYSPPRIRQQRPMSAAFETAIASASTPPPRMATTVMHRPSPELPAARNFPPPPGPSGRGPSRERRFGLPSLGRRRDNDQLSSSPDPQPPALPLRRSLGPSVLYQEPGRMASATMGVQSVPPSSRRAASTGALDTPTSARSRSTSQTRWEPGMPLPPPPPGPPPSNSRSQSVHSMDRTSIPIISPPTRRRPPSGVSSLGPVPPTPANWVDEDVQSSQAKRSRSPGLTIDTAAASSAQDVSEPLTSSGSASGGLSRARAVRHDKTIIQRRAESRSRHAAHGSIDLVSQPQKISDIVVPETSANRKLHPAKSTPHSGGGMRPDLYRAGEPSCQADSRTSTPRAPSSAKLPHLEAATPPFSPYPAKAGRASDSSHSAVPKALPTPPPQTRSASCSRARGGSRPSVSTITPVSQQAVVAQSADQFAAATIERFRAFAEKEVAAATDADRVRMFADFIVSESMIRRERYSVAIGAMGSEIFDLTRDLFRPMAGSRRESFLSQGERTPASTESAAPRRDSVGTTLGGDGLSSSAPASANLSTTPSPGMANNGTWASNYMPSLSPILSMSVSDNYENGSSRGRPPSRWWESDSQGDGSRVFERSKRESKYMGVPKDQWVEEEAAPVLANEYGPSSEYPPEKRGWHEQGESPRTPDQSRMSAMTLAGSSMSPSTCKPESLDVSRLVTMPPPYPRHHPAVNNSHPELAAARGSVRALGDLSEVDKAKERFTIASSKRRQDFSRAVSERRQSLRANLQKEINAGNLGYADAAAIESDSRDQEKDREKELEKTEYEAFQNEVILPLNDLLTGRICRAKDLFDDLSRHLFDNGEIDADMPQEEGDDRPELLEKLTLLKWIFEMRETLHRAIYDILSDRNARYREVVMTPYRLTGNTEKLASAESFFAEDAAKREYAYANEVLDRAREFRSVMEEAVERGVALQLSAFWDIAPPLRQLLDCIPDDLGGFSIQIPASELDENPSYHDHPLQYLLSLLQHTEKSTHQFIESHTNLLCLLHEVKEAVVHAKARVLATRVEEVDGRRIRPEEREERARAMRQSEDRRLTEDLKEKVRVVQDQWNGALGEGIKRVKGRTAAWLVQAGGWDEALEESGVFGAT